jgi:predicted transcriptional regulator
VPAFRKNAEKNIAKPDKKKIAGSADRFPEKFGGRMKKGHFTKARVAAVVAMHDAGHSARAIGRELQCSPNTALAYISRAAEYLKDPLVKKLIEKWRETEADDLVALRAKARARLHEKLDNNKMKPIELIALQDRAFTQSRLIEEKSTANLALRGILKIQQEALEKTIKAISVPTDAMDAVIVADANGKSTDKPRTKRKRAANA